MQLQLLVVMACVAGGLCFAGKTHRSCLDTASADVCNHATLGNCARQSTYRNNCRKSCGLCRPQDQEESNDQALRPCLDTASAAVCKHATLGNCARQSTYRNNCRKSCGLCRQQDQEGSNYQANRFTCWPCKRTWGAVAVVLQRPGVRHTVMQAMESACKLLPKKDQVICKDLVDNYGDQLLSWLSDPVKVCTGIKMCTPSQLLPQPSDVMTQPQPSDVMTQPQPSDVACWVCEQVFDVLGRLIVQPIVQQRLKEAMELGCEQLPGSEKFACEQLVENYGNQLVTWLVGHMTNSTVVCQQLHTCQPAQQFNTNDDTCKDSSPTCQDLWFIQCTMSREIREVCPFTCGECY